MPADPSDLTTVAKVKDFVPGLDPTATDLDGVIQELVTNESAWFRSQVNRDVQRKTYAEVRNGNGKTTLYLGEFPVISIASVTVDGAPIPQRAGVTDSGWVLLEKATGRLELVGYTFARGTANVEVAYEAGFDPVPHDIEQAVIERVALTLKDREHIGQSYRISAGETVDFKGGSQLPRIMAVVEKYRRWGVG